MLTRKLPRQDLNLRPSTTEEICKEGKCWQDRDLPRALGAEIAPTEPESASGDRNRTVIRIAQLSGVVSEAEPSKIEEPSDWRPLIVALIVVITLAQSAIDYLPAWLQWVDLGAFVLALLAVIPVTLADEARWRREGRAIERNGGVGLRP